MIPFFAAVAGAVAALARRCPACKRRQVVPRSKRTQRVPCKFCGAEIPAQRSTRSR
jgi:ribosomal protein S27E